MRRGLAVLVLIATMSACGGPSETKGNDVSGNQRETAERVLGSAKLQLPEGAQDVTVDLTGYEDFRDVALVGFTAPRASVLAMCKQSGGDLRKVFALADYEKALLGGVTPAKDDQLCVKTGEFGRGVSANLLIPADDPAKVRVSIFQLPTR